MDKDYKKLYEEALERARDLHDNHPLGQPQTWITCEKIFPILKESEDERIRKELIERFKWELKGAEEQDAAGCSRQQDIAMFKRGIAWLEKQGEQNNLLNFDEAEKEKNDFVSGQFIECRKSFNEFKELESYWLEYVGDDTYIGRSDNILNQKFHITPRQLFTLFTHEHCPKENNDEQKEINTNWEDKIKGLNKLEEYILSLDPNRSLDAVKVDAKNIRFLVNEEQKPVDKVEPKFKVGDWVVYNRNGYSIEIMQIYDIRDNRYYFNDNAHFSWSVKECDEKCHLWTIQDAKDGDVLATKKGNPFIYDKDRYNNGLAYYYAGLDVNKELTLKSPHHMLAHFGELSGVFPATKEQCDLLFSKMKEAGYEWDAEKKELKKIEIEQKPAEWSEEDELILNDFISSLKYNHENAYNKQISWLKSLKDRILPQPKQEWSEEDEKIINDAIWLIEHYVTDGHKKLLREQTIDKLKSLKPQSHWKPSEEQMQAIKYFIDFHRPQANASTEGWSEFKHLENLYNKLKKL